MDAQGAGLEMRIRRRRSIAHTSQAGLLVVALAAAFAGCGDRSGAAAPPPPPVVRVTPVIERDVPITFEYVGTLVGFINAQIRARVDRKSTRLNSSHTVISYAVFCLKKKTKT